MAGEVKHPERNLPLALIASMFIIIALYVIVNVSYFYVMSLTDVASVSATGSVAAASIGEFWACGGDSDGWRHVAFFLGLATDFNSRNRSHPLRDGS